MNIKRALIATDLSDHGLLTMRYAASKVFDRATEITVFSVVTPYPLIETPEIPPIDLEETLVQATKARLSNAVVDTLSQFRAVQNVRVSLNPAEEIVAEADRMHADLIIMGSHGAGATASLFIGSTVQRVLRLAKVPVLVVPAHVSL